MYYKLKSCKHGLRVDGADGGESESGVQPSFRISRSQEQKRSTRHQLKTHYIVDDGFLHYLLQMISQGRIKNELRSEFVMDSVCL